MSEQESLTEFIAENGRIVEQCLRSHGIPDRRSKLDVPDVEEHFRNCSVCSQARAEIHRDIQRLKGA